MFYTHAGPHTCLFLLTRPVSWVVEIKTKIKKDQSPTVTCLGFGSNAASRRANKIGSNTDQGHEATPIFPEI